MKIYSIRNKISLKFGSSYSSFYLIKNLTDLRNYIIEVRD